MLPPNSSPFSQHTKSLKAHAEVYRQADKQFDWKNLFAQNKFVCTK